ncbi:MAG TPA: hypothetical protein VFO73_04515 [Candidatus Limnocylindrales bacterium]|nr:hypothetical protein [Candidatus Limnocylindrales bacterium]
MRTFLRLLAATTTLTALLVGLQASPINPTTPVARAAEPAQAARYVYDDEWCFDYGATYDCTVQRAALIVTVTPDGRDIARITFRQDVTSYDASGNEIGSYQTVSLDRTVFADGGQDKTFSVSHVNAEGEWGSCTSTYLFKVVDYELQMDKYVGPDCA